MRRIVPLVLLLALLAAGCGSSKKEAAPTLPTVPRAKTQAEWIDRLVNRFLRDMNENLTVVNGLRSPQIQIYLRTGNETTLRVLRARMTDLRTCSGRLARVGPPPASPGPLERIYANFGKACPQYERVADAVLRAAPLLSSGVQDKVLDGEKEFARAAKPSREGARFFSAAVEILERNGLLRAYER